MVEVGNQDAPTGRLPVRRRHLVHVAPGRDAVGRALARVLRRRDVERTRRWASTSRGRCVGERGHVVPRRRRRTRGAARRRAPRGRRLPGRQSRDRTRRARRRRRPRRVPSVRAGDIVLVRTGRVGRAIREGAYPFESFIMASPGLSVRCADWLVTHDVAAVAADNVAVETTQPEADGHDDAAAHDLPARRRHHLR